MSMRARAVIPYENGIILVHRMKSEDGSNKEYYVFPGGGVENQETPEECVIREVYEELGIQVQIVKKLYEVENQGNQEVFFLCKFIKGEFGTGCGPEFTSNEYADKGKYITEIIGIEKMNNLLVFPENIKYKVIEEYNSFMI